VARVHDPRERKARGRFGLFARSCRLAVVVSVLAVRGSAASGGESTSYLKIARACADALIKHGRDDLGPQRTGMILSMLDRRTLRPPTKLPKAPAGIRKADRTTLFGSNANLQQNLYVAWLHLSRLTGEPGYARAAREALIDFLRLAQHPDTGLLAWGEHLCWDCRTDTPGTLMGAKLIHEPKRKVQFFDLLYAAEPERTLAYARGLWEHQIADHKTGNFSRHARYDAHGPGKDYDFPKEGSYFIDCWSRALQKSHDRTFLEAIRVLAQRYLGKLNDHDRMDFDSTTRPERENNCITIQNLGLAIECHDAATRVDSQTAKVLRQLAGRLDRGFLALPHAPADPKRGFVYCVYTDSGELRPRKGGDGHSRHWGMGYGAKSTMMYGLLCHTRQAHLGKTPAGRAYRGLVLAAADLYRGLAPDPRGQDLWAGEYGMAIFLEIAAYRLGGNQAYLDRARALADQAIAVFWDGDGPLPRASSRTRHYEAITRPDTLILALLALHEHVSGLEPKIPISDVDR